MMKLALLSTFSFVACATTGSMPVDRESGARASVQLEFPTEAVDRAVFPTAIDPRLPSVDRIAHQVRARLGAEVVASLELCVAPDGHVTKVALREGTAFAPFDAAIVRDAERWQFTALPGRTATAALQTCETATVKYLAP
ncbi:MAG: hypothetical protein H0T89_36815 [Deltaproteobacteria bacterium]|nr:hypothetical protein [Deltaproteobacteria bacterium]MDQ3297803.1 energy transducer TonB [Myxococcota bacterium]